MRNRSAAGQLLAWRLVAWNALQVLFTLQKICGGEGVRNEAMAVTSDGPWGHGAMGGAASCHGFQVGDSKILKKLMELLEDKVRTLAMAMGTMGTPSSCLHMIHIY